MSSDEGLDAYGAATWGQFFLYQGFNPHVGWMHTSSGVDNVDEFAETVERRGSGYCYRYGKTCRPLRARPITIRYRTADGHLASRSFTAWMTHRGPIVRRENGRWIAFAMMDRPVEALQQSFLRTKASDLASFMAVSELKANSSNNAVVADDKGNIAVLAPEFMPRRDNRFDYTRPVDGSDPRADWHGLHAVSELPNTIDPPTGWAFNSNDWLYSAAGRYSPKPANFPAYLDTAGESYRTIHATRLLTQPGPWSLDRLQTAAFDSAQPSFEVLVPMLVAAWQALPASDPRRARLSQPVAALASWDKRWSVASVPNTLAQFWGDELAKAATSRDWNDHRNVFRHMEALSPEEKIATFTRGLDRLERDFGGWRVPWGEVNRFQRISPAIEGAVRRFEAEYSGRFHLEQMGLARLLRSLAEAGNEEVVRHQRQQLRRRGRVRQASPGASGDRRRRERASRLAALRRRGAALRLRQPPRRLFLPGPAQGPHRADLPPRRVSLRRRAPRPPPTPRRRTEAA